MRIAEPISKGLIKCFKDDTTKRWEKYINGGKLKPDEERKLCMIIQWKPVKKPEFVESQYSAYDKTNDIV